MISAMQLLAGADYETRYQRYPPRAMLRPKREQSHLWVKHVAALQSHLRSSQSDLTLWVLSNRVADIGAISHAEFWKSLR